MSILRILFYAFLIYLAWRLVFDFIIPVYRTTRQVRRGFRAMQDHMQQQSPVHPPRQSGPAPADTPKPSAGEYIDFEEID